MSKKYYLGVDSCPYGWVVFWVNQSRWDIQIFKHISSLWKKYKDAQLILIDIPIGLREKSGKARLCDTAARKYLAKRRSSSIFPTPCRKALISETYQQANTINKEITGKGLSKQTYNIMHKIKEVDGLIRKKQKAPDIIMESHPEVCFTALNNKEPLKYYKKTKEGIKNRLKLLKSLTSFDKNPLEIAKRRFKRKDVAVDDVLDAWVLAISASKGKQSLRYLPSSYEFDEKGLPMRIAYPKKPYNENSH
jgi:predicted RNase H-like nuclease